MYLDALKKLSHEERETAIKDRNEMLPVVIDATDLDDAWFQVIRCIMDYGHYYGIQRGSYEGSGRIELDSATIHVMDPGSGPLVPHMPEALGIPAPAELEYVRDQYFPQYLFSNVKSGNEQYTYGERLNQPIVDGHLNETMSQLEWAIKMLSETPQTNQATIEIACPEDITARDPSSHHPDPPCLRLLDFRVRYGKLHVFPYFRSWDAWGGFPANLGGIELLKQYMADEIGVGNGSIIAFSKGLHIYDHVEKAARIRLHMEKEDR